MNLSNILISWTDKVKTAYNSFYRIDDSVSSMDKYRLLITFFSNIVFLLSEILRTAVIYANPASTNFERLMPYISITGLIACAISYRYMRPFFLYSMLLIMGYPALIVVTGFITGDYIFEEGFYLFPLVVLFAGMYGGTLSALLGTIITTVSIVAFAYLGVSHTALGGDQVQYIYWHAGQLLFNCLAVSVLTMFAYNYMTNLFESLEQKLDQAQKAERKQSRFLANMSHELRTPLNGIMGMSGLLAKAKLDPINHQYATIVNDCSHSLLHIINDVLDVSKLDADTLNIKEEPFQVQTMLNDTIKLYQTLAMQKGLTLQYYVDPKVPHCLIGDVDRVRQVINNLTSNAIKFTRSGSVTIGVTGEFERSDFRIRVAIQDTGIGIKKEHLDVIFERFGQVDNTFSREHDGTGLGLAICRELVEYMGGEMDVSSVLNQGSTFYFELTLPVHENAAQPVQKKTKETTMPPRAPQFISPAA